MVIRLTEKAVKEIKHIIAEQGYEKTFVRMGIRGGGCSGYQFVFNLDEVYNEVTDTIFEQDDLQIVVDKRSEIYLDGTTVDFHDSLEKRGFSFDNPKIQSRCGCGSSVSY